MAYDKMQFMFSLSQNSICSMLCMNLCIMLMLIFGLTHLTNVGPLHPDIATLTQLRPFRLYRFPLCRFFLLMRESVSTKITLTTNNINDYIPIITSYLTRFTEFGSLGLNDFPTIPVIKLLYYILGTVESVRREKNGSKH